MNRSALRESEVAAAGPTPLHRNRDFLVLWVGQFVSSLGSEVSGIAFPLLVLALTGSPVKAGLVGSANWAPVLVFYLPAGVLVDRVDRKLILIASSTAGALALGSLPIALLAGHLGMGQLLAVAFVQGTVTVLFSVTEQSALPQVVDPSQVSDAVARNEARSNSALFAGPPLGGLLFGLSRTLPFTADAISYLASALSLLLLRTKLQQARQAKPDRRMGREIAEGLGWLWHQRFIRASALAVAAGNFVSIALEITLVVRAKQHGASSTQIGVMFALLAVGALSGSFLAPVLRRRLSGAVIVIATFWVEAAMLPLMTLTTSPYVLGAIAGLYVLLAPAWNAVVVGARLTLTPDDIRGRVNSGARLISGAMLPIGSLTAGLLIQATNTTTTLLALTVFQGLVAAASAASGSIRHGIPPTVANDPS